MTGMLHVLQPMLEYIERKGILGQDGSLAIQKSAAATRTTVELANCVDFARRTRDDVPSVALRLNNFLEVYRARQIKQRNTRTGERSDVTQSNLYISPSSR